MVSFGLIDSWSPEPGELVTWRPSAASLAAALAAPADDVPPSHIQQAYLEDNARARAAYAERGLDVRPSRLCLVAFDLPGQVDVAAMSRALTAFVTRHDSFLSWFAPGPDGPVRHVVAAADVVLDVSTPRTVTDPAELLRVAQETPGPDVWGCFGFGTVQHENSFTLFTAYDHLVTDGISGGMTVVDLRHLYWTACEGEVTPLFDSGSYRAYCARERGRSAALTRDSEPVRRWIEIVQRNGGDLPHFPLDLRGDRAAEDGLDEFDELDRGRSRTAAGQFPMLDRAEGDAFDAACATVGGRFTGGLFAAAALTQYELAGESHYVGMSPKSTRETPAEWASIGWFASLIPVEFDVAGAATFTELVGRAQRAFDAGKTLGDVSFHRVLELARPDDGIRTRPGWTIPMLSYVDIRRMPDTELIGEANIGIFANRGLSDEVYLWVNRFPEHTDATFLYPGTDTADAAVVRWFDRFREIFRTVARVGDRPVAVPTAVRVPVAL